MSKHENRYYLVILFALLSLMTTACYQDSAEGVGAQPVSELLNGTPIASAPTVTDAEDTVADSPADTEAGDVVTVVPTDAVVADANVDMPTLTVTPELTSTPFEMMSAVDATMTIDPLFLRLTPSATPLGGLVTVGDTIPGGTAIAQGVTAVPNQTEVIDTFSLTATAVISVLTQTSAVLTATGEFEAGLGVTATPMTTLTLDAATGQDIPPTVAIIPGANCVHQIRPGETLFKLSLAYGVSVNEMSSASGITNPSLILVGQRVTIPSCGTTGFRPPATSVPLPTATVGVSASTDTSTQNVAAGSDTTNTLAQLAQEEILNNAQVDIQADAIVQSGVPATGSRTHTVQQYETLFKIAQMYGTTVDTIAILNGITNINQITMGDVLQIP
jgi:LysM repeat protein